MRAAFIPALPPSALLAGMIAPSFRLVNRFAEKSCFARAAAVSGRTRCARYFLGRRSLMCCFARSAAVSGRPRCARYSLGRRSLMSKGPCPLTARCGMGRLCGERRRRQRFERLQRKKRASPHPVAPPAGPLARTSRRVVWRAAALQVKSYRPAPPGGRGVCAPRRKHSLHVSPAAPKAQGKRAPPGGKDRQRRAFPTPAVRRGFSDELIAVCRSSPRCPR